MAGGLPGNRRERPCCHNPNRKTAPGHPLFHPSGKEVTNARVRVALYGSEELSQGRLP